MHDNVNTKLFVIKQRGRDLFWTCSAEHGSGWNSNNPKQSFSPSELVKEIRRLIDEKWFTDIEVCELIVRGTSGSGEDMCEAQMPSDMDRPKLNRCPTCGRRQ